MKDLRAECNVIRTTSLSGRMEWADGDFSIVHEDGRRENCTLYEYLKAQGLPEEYCRKQSDTAIKL